MIAKDIKEAILDRVKAQIDSSNYGMMGTYKMSPSSCHTLRKNGISFNGDIILMNDIQIAVILRRYSTRKKQLKPIIKYI